MDVGDSPSDLGQAVEDLLIAGITATLLLQQCNGPVILNVEHPMMKYMRQMEKVRWPRPGLENPAGRLVEDYEDGIQLSHPAGEVAEFARKRLFASVDLHILYAMVARVTWRFSSQREFLSSSMLHRAGVSPW
jgi:hypothetical protein